MNTEMKLSFMLLAGIAGAIIIALIALPALAGDTYIISRSGSGNETTQCFNVGNGTVIIKQSLSGNCYVKTLVGSNDISISNGTNTITIDYNGTSSESTQCINVGSQTVVIKNSTAGNCYVKSFTTGKGLTISNGTNTITITTNFVNGTGISITGSGAQTFTNTGVISNSCSSPISCSGTNPSTISCPTCVTTTSENIIKICSVNATNTATSYACNNLAQYKTYVIVVKIDTQTSTSTWGIQFNNDTGNNYADKPIRDASVPAGTTSRGDIRLSATALNSGDRASFYCYVDNSVIGDRKAVSCIGTTGLDSSVATAPAQLSVSGKWGNTSNIIQTITVERSAGTGTSTADSYLVVYGYN